MQWLKDNLFSSSINKDVLYFKLPVDIWQQVTAHLEANQLRMLELTCKYNGPWIVNKADWSKLWTVHFTKLQSLMPYVEYNLGSEVTSDQPTSPLDPREAAIACINYATSFRRTSQDRFVFPPRQPFCRC